MNIEDCICGHQAFIHGPDEHGCFVYCTDCEGEINIRSEETQEKAVEAWNRMMKRLQDIVEMKLNKTKDYEEDDMEFPKESMEELVRMALYGDEEK